MDSIAPWKTTKWLVCSSFSFLIPSLFSYYKQSYFLSNVLLCASVISVNHWRDAKFNSLRRKIDIHVSKICCRIIFIYNLFYVTLLLHRILLYTSLCILLCCFYLSGVLYKDTNVWCLYHFLFHIQGTCIAMLITYNIKI